MKTAKRFYRISLLALLGLVLLLLLPAPAPAQTRFKDFTLLSVPSPDDLFLIDSYSAGSYRTKVIKWRDLMAQIAAQTQEQITTNNFTNSFFYTTNLYSQDTYVSNLFATNILVNNTYVSNLFATNIWSTNAFISNLYATNIYNQNQYVSNFFATNLTVFNDTYVSNFFATNLYTTTLVTSNTYTTNLTAKVINITTILAGDGTFTNGQYFVPHTWPGPTSTLPLHLARQHYATYTPVSITGYTEKSNTVTESVLLTITNAAATNITLYLPGGTMTGNWTNQYTVSNASTAKIWFEYDPGSADTNAVFRQMK